MYGNLKAFAGHDAYNEYAQHLREHRRADAPHGGLLWIVRVGLIARAGRARLLRGDAVASGRARPAP